MIGAAGPAFCHDGNGNGSLNAFDHLRVAHTGHAAGSADIRGDAFQRHYRAGYMILPECLAERFSAVLGFCSCTVPTFEQYVLAELISGGDFELHINRVRRALRKEKAGKKESGSKEMPD